MYTNLQKKIPGGGNTGTCRPLAEYLEHENEDKIQLGMMDQMIPLFDRDGKAVDIEKVIAAIDGNHKHLHDYDAKFFSIIFAPSDKEIEAMGATREERIAACHEMVRINMDSYAQGFGTDKVKDHNDLMYYYTFHEYRKNEEEELVPGLHPHIIVCRNDATGNVKLSPRTNFRSGGTSEKACIKRGFSRDAFYRQCEANFDVQFGYLRSVEESYDYCNAMRNGTAEERRVQIERAVEAQKIEEKIADAFAERAGRLARDAEDAQRRNDEDDKALNDALAKERLRRRNEFWNAYHSQYKPKLDLLSQYTDDALRCYRVAKEKYALVSLEVDEEYERLYMIRDEFYRQKRAFEAAVAVEDFMTGFAALIALANPMAGLVVFFLFKVISSSRKNVARQGMMDLVQQASGIRDNIDSLAEQKKEMALDKNNLQQDYKDAAAKKKEFQENLTKLKDELDKPVETKSKLEALSRRFEEHHKIAQQEKPAISEDAGLAMILEDTFKNSNNMEILNQKLSVSGIFSLSPIWDEKGLVVDFSMYYDGAMVKASKVCTDKQLAYMLHRNERLTGQRPAAKVEIENKPKTITKKNNYTPKI